MASYVAMDMIGEIENRSALRELEYVTFWREHIHLLIIEIHTELIHNLKVVASLKDSTDACKPRLHTVLAALHALVTPVCCKSVLSYLIHSLRANLYLHPFLLRAENRDMKTLVAVCLRHAEPVAQTLRIRLIHIRHYAVNLPAFHLLTLRGRVKNDTDSEEVVNALEGTLLLLHLLPDGMDALGAPFDMEFESCLLKFLLHRTYEVHDIFVA